MLLKTVAGPDAVIWGCVRKFESMLKWKKSYPSRFPSLHTGPEEFVTVPWNERRNTDEKIKLTIAGRFPSFFSFFHSERIWYWLCGIPRKVWLIIGAILICILSFLIVGLILTFVLPRNSSGQAEPQEIGTTEGTSSLGTTTTPINYPIIINVGTETTWFPIGFMESMAPDNRGYDFRDRYRELRYFYPSFAFQNPCLQSDLHVSSAQWNTVECPDEDNPAAWLYRL